MDFINSCDFKQPISPENETMAIQLLTSFLEHSLSKFKPSSHYQDVVDNLSVQSKADYDKRNIN